MDLQERVNKAIGQQREQAESLVALMDAHGGSTETQTLTIIVGWLKGIEDAIDEVVLDVERLTAERN